MVSLAAVDIPEVRTIQQMIHKAKGHKITFNFCSDSLQFCKIRAHHTRNVTDFQVTLMGSR